MKFSKVTGAHVPYFHLLETLLGAVCIGLTIFMVQSVSGGMWLEDYIALGIYALCFGTAAMLSGGRLDNLTWLRRVLELNTGAVCASAAGTFMGFLGFAFTMSMP